MKGKVVTLAATALVALGVFSLNACSKSEESSLEDSAEQLGKTAEKATEEGAKEVDKKLNE